MNKINLAPYLPSVGELEGMKNDQFVKWMQEATDDIKQRIVERDPLTHVRKRVSEIIVSSMSEEHKELAVLEVIRDFQNPRSMSS